MSAPPATTNVTGSRSFTDSGASSPSTTNVNITHTAVGIASLGDNTPREGCAAGPSEGRSKLTLSDGIGLDPRRRFVYLRGSLSVPRSGDKDRSGPQ